MNLRKRTANYRTLLLWALATAIVWLVLQAYSSTIDGIPKKNDLVDLFTIGFAALGATALVVVTLKGTHKWTARGVGLLAIFLGDSILWWSVEAGRIDQTRTPEPITDLIRAIFLTGLPLVLFGVIGYLDETRPVAKSDREKFLTKVHSVQRRGGRQNRREVRQDRRETKLDHREGFDAKRQVEADIREGIAATRQNDADIRQLDADRRQNDADIRDVAANTRQRDADTRDGIADKRETDADDRQALQDACTCEGSKE